MIGKYDKRMNEQETDGKSSGITWFLGRRDYDTTPRSNSLTEEVCMHCMPWSIGKVGSRSTDQPIYRGVAWDRRCGVDTSIDRV